MDLRRILFLIGFFFISFTLIQFFKTEKFFYKDKLENFSIKKSRFLKKKKIIIIKNDVLKICVNLYGGDIEGAFLLKYKENLNSPNSFQLLKKNESFSFFARNGVVGKDGSDNLLLDKRPLYTVSNKKLYELKNGKDVLCVPIQWISKKGVVYRKVFILKKGDYSIRIENQVINNSSNKIEVSTFGQLVQSISLPEDEDIQFNESNNRKDRIIAYSADSTKYAKYSFQNVKNNRNLYLKTNSGWIAMMQKYFLTAWIPCSLKGNTFYTHFMDDSEVLVGCQSKNYSISPHCYRILCSKIWIGPKIQEKLFSVSPNLELTIDYGWLWFLSYPLFKLLIFLNSFLQNWGLSIIIITVLVRLLTYPLTRFQYIEEKKMRALHPAINKIRNNLKGNEKKINEEIISLYRKKKINPIISFFPVFVQMPLFFALYNMLVESVELRHAPFFGWIQDLSSKDPCYFLPILMGLTTFFMQRVSDKKNINVKKNKVRNSVSDFIPIFFSIFFFWFPSGLVLYYIVSNFITILQKKYIFFEENNIKK